MGQTPDALFSLLLPLGPRLWEVCVWLENQKRDNPGNLQVLETLWRGGAQESDL